MENTTCGRHYTVTIIDRVNLITALERAEKMLSFDIYMSSLNEKMEYPNNRENKINLSGIDFFFLSLFMAARLLFLDILCYTFLELPFF